MGSQTVREFMYAFSAVCPAEGAIDSLIMPTMQTECFQHFIDYVAAQHPDELNVLVGDGAACHAGAVVSAETTFASNEKCGNEATSVSGVVRQETLAWGFRDSCE